MRNIFFSNLVDGARRRRAMLDQLNRPASHFDLVHNNLHRAGRTFSASRPVSASLRRRLNLVSFADVFICSRSPFMSLILWRRGILPDDSNSLEKTAINLSYHQRQLRAHTRETGPNNKLSWSGLHSATMLSTARRAAARRFVALLTLVTSRFRTSRNLSSGVPPSLTRNNSRAESNPSRIESNLYGGAPISMSARETWGAQEAAANLTQVIFRGSGVARKALEGKLLVALDD